MKSQDLKKWAMIGGGLAGLVIIFKGYRVAAAAGDRLVRGINPTRSDNFAYSGVNAVGEAVSGDGGWSLGGWLYEKLNPEQAARDNAAADDYVINSNQHEGIAE